MGTLETLEEQVYCVLLHTAVSLLGPQLVAEEKQIADRREELCRFEESASAATLELESQASNIDCEWSLFQISWC